MAKTKQKGAPWLKVFLGLIVVGVIVAVAVIGTQGERFKGAAIKEPDLTWSVAWEKKVNLIAPNEYKLATITLKNNANYEMIVQGFSTVIEGLERGMADFRLISETGDILSTTRDLHNFPLEGINLGKRASIPIELWVTANTGPAEFRINLSSINVVNAKNYKEVRSRGDTTPQTFSILTAPVEEPAPVEETVTIMDYPPNFITVYEELNNELIYGPNWHDMSDITYFFDIHDDPELTYTNFDFKFEGCPVTQNNRLFKLDYFHPQTLNNAIPMAMDIDNNGVFSTYDFYDYQTQGIAAPQDTMMNRFILVTDTYNCSPGEYLKVTLQGISWQEDGKIFRAENVMGNITSDPYLDTTLNFMQTSGPYL